MKSRLGKKTLKVAYWKFQPNLCACVCFKFWVLPSSNPLCARVHISNSGFRQVFILVKTLVTLLLISVENARPISWQSNDDEDVGVRRTKMKRTGIWISIKFGISTPRDSRIKATRGSFRLSRDPTIVIVPCVPGASLLLMLSFFAVLVKSPDELLFCRPVPMST